MLDIVADRNRATGDDLELAELRRTPSATGRDRCSPELAGELGNEQHRQPAVRDLGRGVSRMNDPAGVANNADKARTVVESILPKVDAVRWTDTDIRALMRAITDDRDFILASDVHAAEQHALALQSLNSALTRRNPRLLRGPLTKSIDALFDEIANRDDYEPSRFVEKLSAVRTAL